MKSSTRPWPCTGPGAGCQCAGVRSFIRSVAQTSEELIDLFPRHPTAHLVIVHQQYRGVAAGAHALALLEGELAVRSGFVEIDAQPLLHILSGMDSAR